MLTRLYTPNTVSWLPLTLDISCAKTGSVAWLSVCGCGPYACVYIPVACVYNYNTCAPYIHVHVYIICMHKKCAARVCTSLIACVYFYLHVCVCFPTLMDTTYFRVFSTCLHTSLSLVNPRHTCAARVTVVGFVYLSVKPHLISGASVRPEIDVTYSTSNEDQKICSESGDSALFPLYGQRMYSAKVRTACV